MAGSKTIGKADLQFYFQTIRKQTGHEGSSKWAQVYFERILSSQVQWPRFHCEQLFRIGSNELQSSTVKLPSLTIVGPQQSWSWGSSIFWRSYRSHSLKAGIWSLSFINLSIYDSMLALGRWPMSISVLKTSLWFTRYGNYTQSRWLNSWFCIVSQYTSKRTLGAYPSRT